MLNFIMAIMRRGELSLQLADSTHAPVAPNEPAWRDLRGNKRLCLLVAQRPPLHPSPPSSLSPERDRPRAECRSRPGGVIRLGPKSPAGRPVCDWRRRSQALVTG